MRISRYLWVAIALAAFASPAMSQSANDASSRQSGNTGASSPEMGVTGWSGPHRGQTSPGHPDAPAATDSPDKQPPTATGVDLKGEPKAFPSNKTPE